MTKKKKQKIEKEISKEISLDENEKKEVIEKVEEKPKKGKSKDVSSTTSLSIIDTDELNSLIDEDLNEKKETISKTKHHYFIHAFLMLLFIVSFLYFGILIVDKTTPILSLINNLILTIFSILFVVISITYKRNNKTMIFFATCLLMGYYILGINNHFQLVDSPVEVMPNFLGKSVTEAIQWASKNHITIHQEYEYSDMILEYNVLSQSIESGTALKDLKEITIAISEGPNPSKEIIVPSMLGWDTERVIRFVKDNHLSNVDVEFVESDKAKDTVIEQNTSGTLKRNEELKLTFSYGEELGYDDVTIIDFTNMSKFEVEFYMKQHQLRYEFGEEFDKKIKKGFAVKQDIKAGEVVSINDQRIHVTISKGPEIKVPDLLKFSMMDITEWAIQNKLKLNFQDGYDDKIKENGVIEANYKEGDTIEQGTVIKVTISRGSLKMPNFKSLSDFYDWANQYEIPYEEEHEFHDTISSGEVISYSYKVGQAIKKGDTIHVKISDGMKKTVPNIIGLSKSDAISKLEKAGLNYHFVYRNSDKKKDIVTGQSLASGSEVSNGTTITVTISNGKETSNEEKSSNSSKTEESKKEEKNNEENKKEDNSSNENSSNNEEKPKEEEKPTCNSCSFRAAQITSTLQQYTTYEAAANGLKNYLQNKCPGLKVTIVGEEKDGYDPGDYISGFKGGETDSCSSISITLAK